MSPGAALAGVLASAPAELLLVIGSAGALYGLICLYWWVRRSVIPYVVPGVAFRSVAGQVAGRVFLKKVMK